MKVTYVWIVGGIVALSSALLVTWYLGRSPSQKPAVADRRALAADEPAPQPEVAPAAPPVTLTEARRYDNEPKVAPMDASANREKPDEEEPMPVVPPPEAGGALEALKDAFAHATRDDEATQIEAHIRELARSDDVPSNILLATTCRDAVCKIEVEWSTENALAYHALLVRLSYAFRPDFAIEPQRPLDHRGVMPVNIYLPREGYVSADISE